MTYETGYDFIPEKYTNPSLVATLFLQKYSQRKNVLLFYWRFYYWFWWTSGTMVKAGKKNKKLLWSSPHEIFLETIKQSNNLCVCARLAFSRGETIRIFAQPAFKI